MSIYKCIMCKKEMEWKQFDESLRCPYCGFRVVQKVRPKNIKRVKAI
ncbi:MAG: DNA-directed RNA polymerase subunit P [Candidatus Aenigmatarchaeota archaeon]